MSKEDDYIYVVIGQGDHILELESEFMNLLSKGYEIIHSVGSGIGAHYILRKTAPKEQQEEDV